MTAQQLRDVLLGLMGTIQQNEAVIADKDQIIVKALIGMGVTEIGCMAHARRKFLDLHAANRSQIAERTLRMIGLLYDVEREVKELGNDERKRIRQEKARPLADTLFEWMCLHRAKVPDGSATAKAMNYSISGAACRRRHDAGPVGQAQRTRSVCRH